MKKVSVLLPTRKRFGLFNKSVTSLFNKCSNVDNFEVLVALDIDDTETIIKIENFIIDKPNVKYFLYERSHYENLHDYYNDLINKSTGTSLFLWNDDAVMDSDGWDLEILKYHKNFCVINPKVSTMVDFWSRHVLFPIIPKKWVELTGQWAPYRGLDSWVDVLGKRLNIIENVSTIIITHDRFDLTGNNNDGTYVEGRIGGTPIDEQLLDVDYNILKEYLNTINISQK